LELQAQVSSSAYILQRIMILSIKIIGIKFNAKITYIGYGLRKQSVMHLKEHTVSVTPATSIAGIALNDNKIKTPIILKNII
jgi:hypothetical protein